MNHQKGFANVILIGVIVVLVGVIGYLTLVKRPIAPEQSSTGTNGNEKTYRDSSFEFKYPSILTINPQSEGILITHAASYRHASPCDFKGDAPLLDKITDFDVSLKVFGSGLKDTMRTNETDYLMSSFFQGTTIKTSPGFIDEFNIGSLRGYRVTTGVEGCGRYTYYFPLSTSKTLFASRSFISEFQSINADYQTYLNVPGVIPPAQEENFFKTILSSFKAML